MPRFMRKGKTKIRWAPTISNLAAPTTAQVTAGVDLTPQIAEIAGFTFSNSPITVPDMSSAFNKKINGEDSVEDSSLTFYEDDVTNTIMTTLAKGTTGFILIYSAGTAGVNPAANDKLEVWPVTVASVSRLYTASNEAAQYRIMFTNTDAPTAATQAA